MHEPQESVTYLGSDGETHRWNVEVPGARGRGRALYYEVTTRTLPSGRVEAIGPNKRRHHLEPDASKCACFEGRWGPCIHSLAVRAHVERLVAAVRAVR